MLYGDPTLLLTCRAMQFQQPKAWHTRRHAGGAALLPLDHNAWPAGAIRRTEPQVCAGAVHCGGP